MPPRFSVLVEPLGRSFDADESTALLTAARSAGIDLPASCRNGTCRTCMCRLLSGRVGYRIEWPGLTREEKAEGLILPCVAYPESDLVINAPGARLPSAG